jgi:hypothetical protein
MNFVSFSSSLNATRAERSFRNQSILSAFTGIKIEKGRRAQNANQPPKKSGNKLATKISFVVRGTKLRRRSKSKRFNYAVM